MTPESIVVSLENAKKLKEAGFPQESSEFYYDYQTDLFDEKEGVVRTQYVLRHSSTLRPNASLDGVSVNDGSLAAPTSSEIIRKIPVNKRGDISLEVLDDPNEWAALYCALQSTYIS